MHSATPHLVRAFSADAIGALPPNTEKALIGVRAIQGDSFLIAKLSWRKNITSGCILRRPCSCALEDAQAQLLRPVHALWPLIRRRVQPGIPLFRAANRQNFNRIFKAIMSKMHIAESSRYSPHASRRRTTQGLKESGPPWSVFATSGIWYSPDFRGYVDMSRDVAIGAQ